MPPPGKESLLSGSAILLFGRELFDITIKHDDYDGIPRVKRRGKNKLMDRTLLDGKDSRFARMYAFSYDGRLYDLDPPVIFLVHGEGDDPENERPYSGADPSRLVAEGRSMFEKVGVAMPSGIFARDIRVWSYDKSDFSIRMEVVSGMLDHILLEAELGQYDDHAYLGGGKVGGGKVGGGKVGGGKVGGGKVGGGKVGGGKVGGE